ncbi:MAG: PTH1 family peptidyl-tRNA hydrolase [Desulforhopalus sp.]|jgi:PTH1 family peptidyl-tRNA hydrolase
MSRQGHLIVGLGNPGVEYENTRHNIGFHIVDTLFGYFDRTGSFNEKWNGLYGSTMYSGEKIHFIKPQTFMNRSGQSVSQFYSFYKIVPERLVVIHDDLDMAPGRIKLVRGGGNGGHNGIKSIVASIGVNDFYRLKIGIGRPGQGEVHKDFPVEKYVLSNFSQNDLDILGSRYDSLVEGIKWLFAGDVGRAKGVLNSLK